MDGAPPLSTFLDPWQRLHIDCCRCPRKVEMTPEEAIATFGPNMTIPRLKRMLRCSACGARGRDKDISVHPNTGDYALWLDRRKYEREIEQYGQAAADHWWAKRGHGLVKL